jgi:HNH endonuclease
MEIELTQGKVAHIDPEDFPLIAPYKWYAALSDGVWYAHAIPVDGDRSKTKIKMHNLILGLKWIDHRDFDGLNNRRSNLRACTNAQNQQNTRPREGSSRFKGVSWVKSKGRWRVAFRCDGEHHFIGYFHDEKQAARAYDAAILPLAGEFARLNFPIAA